MSTILDKRLTKLESKAPGSAQPVTLIVLAGEHPTPDEQARIDDANALGHYVLDVRLVRANHAEQSK